MNSDVTEKGPYESYGSPTRDWLVERKREHDLMWNVAIGAALFAATIWGVATMGMVHPILAQIARFLGVK